MTRDALDSAIRAYLLQTPQLTRFCSQNGWIDDDSLRFRIERIEPESAEVSVSFVEVIMEGAGCVADRRERFGRLRLQIGADGSIQRAEEA